MALKQEKIIRFIKISVEIVLVALVIFCTLFDWNSINQYAQYNTSSLHYVKGIVTVVDSQKLTQTEEDEALLLGSQVLQVKIISGHQSGETVEVKNYLTRGHAIQADVGSRLIICADESENAEIYYSVYNYDRTVGIAAILIGFAVVMILVGRRKGLYALGSLCFSGLAIVMYAVQAAYHGGRPLVISLLTILSISLFTFILICDNNRKLVVSVLSAVMGIIAALLVYILFSKILNISGYNSEDVDSLVLLAKATGLSIRNLLLIPVSITALGAVMDVTLSLASALDELRTQNKNLNKKQLIKSGMNIGKDMIGTMSNTLILAILGENFLLLILLISYGYQTNQLLSSDLVTVQLAQSIAATIGVIVSVPITTFIYAGYIYGQTSRMKPKRS